MSLVNILSQKKNNNKKTTQIRVSIEVHKRLSEIGKYGESMDDILRRLLDGK